MAQAKDTGWSQKHCPCCGSDLSADPVRRRNFRRWRNACLILYLIAVVFLGLTFAFSRPNRPPPMLYMFSVGVSMAVVTLFHLSGIWRRNEDKR
jgi:O-antigen/teichoic acid export membrane protein